MPYGQSKRKTTIGSLPVHPDDAPVIFHTMQTAAVAMHNRAGRGVVIKHPDRDTLAEIGTRRELESLVRVCTRPLPLI
jgi:hypothetical protein